MSGPVVFALRALLAVGLYVFLAWALVTLWREVKQQGALLTARRIPPISLSIQRGELAPQLRHFHQPEVTIGRNPACECPINEDSISSHHARLSYHHGQWWLEDLASTNGTFLNEEKITLPTVVVSGDEVRCGETRFMVAFSGDLVMSPTQKLFKNDNN
ncbi:MAG: FHA domain-containing protein [Chloroflexi bacterium]|nr:FHA domain-containing protein [Chloroflexota bacterium]